jgi:8-oxo-dGTP diphosphatase
VEEKYNDPIPTVDGVLIKEDKILLVKRGREPFKDTWALPGGFLEVTETAESGVLRELREETGIKAEVDRLIGVYSKPGRDPRGAIISIAYLLKNPSGNAVGADDAAEARWWSIYKLPELAFDHADIISDALKAYYPL